METKWKIIFTVAFALAFLLIVSCVYAQILPKPIAVKVIPAGEYLIRLEDITLSQSYVVSTNEYGEVITDANQIFTGFHDSDVIRATVIVYNSVQERFLGDAVYFEFDLSGVVPATTTTVAPTTTVTTTTVPECPVAPCPDCPECVKDYNEEIIVAVLVLVFTSAGGMFLIKKYFVKFVKNGWGVRIYKSQDGQTIQVFHKHPGIKNYHNPDTVHTNPAVRHLKGKVF